MPVIFAWLAARGVGALAAKLIVYGVISLFAIGALAGARHWIGQPYYADGLKDGTAAQVKLDKPIIAKLTRERDQATEERDRAWKVNEDLGKKLDNIALEAKTSKDAADAFKRLADAARATAARLRAELAAEKAKGLAHVNEMMDIVSGKTVLLDECKSAERILDGLADWATTQ